MDSKSAVRFNSSTIDDPCGNASSASPSKPPAKRLGSSKKSMAKSVRRPSLLMKAGLDELARSQHHCSGATLK